MIKRQNPLTGDFAGAKKGSQDDRRIGRNNAGRFAISGWNLQGENTR